MTEASKYEEELIRRIIESILSHGGEEYITSIVLTGSLGRSEPTYMVNSSGDLKLKSDIEIALIYKNRRSKHIILRVMDAVSREFSEDLNLMPLTEKRVIKAHNYNHSLITPKNKTVFTFDLFNGSRTVWGTDYIKNVKISPLEVDIYEAKRLVANRIGELIYIVGSYSDMEQTKDLKIQWKGKLMLAIASAWLICNGIYASSYHGQCALLKNHRDLLDKDLGNDFLKEYVRVFGFLRDNGEIYEVEDEKLTGYVKNINNYFSILGINSPHTNSFSRALKYIIKYVRIGMPCGIVQFEDKLLQKLIDCYCGHNNDLRKAADIWHYVLY